MAHHWVSQPADQGLKNATTLRDSPEAAAPLATAPTPEKTMDVLAAWCAQQNVPYLWDALRSKLHSRPIIDAADALAARAWYRRHSA
ncbi:hypothetical protein [Tessaracoccus massiliensis]|uniref:hypothetical protein n=1 Tax=Tessaracoccus massiliensis TaxID=1522311 RepID=UPI00111B85C4|nr:hypothetical protein [Tessaracoccus massiliensis]